MKPAPNPPNIPTVPPPPPKKKRRGPSCLILMYSTLAGSNLVSARDRSFVVLVFPLFLPPCTTTLVERVGGGICILYQLSPGLPLAWPSHLPLG